MSGRVAVVTGASGAIGSAVARRFATAGYDLALFGRDRARLEATLARCSEAGIRAEALVCDVKDDSSVATACAKVRQTYSAPDALVLCAGTGRYASFLETGIDDWRGMLEVNVLGVVRFIREFLPQLIERRRGHVVVVGSRRGLEPSWESAAYSSSKAALHGMVKSLSQEASRHGVHVCLLSPGGVKGNFRGVAAGEQTTWLEPENVAEAAAFIVANAGHSWVRQLDILPLGRG